MADERVGEGSVGDLLDDFAEELDCQPILPVQPARNKVQRPLFYLRRATENMGAFPYIGYALHHVRTRGDSLLVVIDESEGSLDSACLETDFAASFSACMQYFSLDGAVTITAPGGKKHQNHPGRKVYLQPKDPQSSALMLAYQAILEREVEH